MIKNLFLKFVYLFSSAAYLFLFQFLLRFPTANMEFDANYWKQLKQLPGRPTVSFQKHDISGEVKLLHKALRFITNRKQIIEILCSRTNAQRVEITKAYKTCFDRELVDEVKRKFRGDFRDLMVAMLTPLNEFHCQELYNALNEAGTDEDALIQILVSLSNREIYEINQKYFKNYGRSLEKDLKSDTSGNFRKLMISLANGTRDETSDVDLTLARVDVVQLKKAGVDRWGTDGSTFNRILSLRSYSQIKMIVEEYEFVTSNTLAKDIKSEFSGNIQEGLLAILRYASNKPEYFARCLYKSMVGLGTNDKALIRLIVTRCEIDMTDIKEEFEEKYGSTLKSFIKGDTSGDYRKALLKLIGE